MADNDTKDDVTEDIGGVQGSEKAIDDNDPATSFPTISPDTVDQPAPDAGEIEWAGGLVKTPPAPRN